MSVAKKIKLAEELVDAFADGRYNFLRQLDEKLDQLIESNFLSVSELNDYQEYFKKKLEAAGKPIAQMSDEEKKSFFADVKAGWKKKKE